MCLLNPTVRPLVRHAVILALACGIVGCSALKDSDVIAPYGRGIEFEDTASQKQVVELGDAGAAIIRCYCQSHRVKVDYSAKAITLRIMGTYSIGGYHGSKADAGAEPIPDGALHFSQERSENKIVLDSAEWQYIHHSLVIDSLEVTTPVQVHFEHYTYEQLYGRGSKRSEP